MAQELYNVLKEYGLLDLVSWRCTVLLQLLNNHRPGILHVPR